MGNREEYIHNLARNLMGRLAINPSDWSPDLKAYDLFKRLHLNITNIVKDYTPETRGKIMACATTRKKEPGRTFIGYASDHEAGFFFEHFRTGDEFLTRIAVCTIIAAISDIIKADILRRDVL